MLLSVVNAYDRGASPEEIVKDYPSLALADAYATIAFYLQHCGHSAHADVNAALNIAFLAAVKQPIVVDGKSVKPTFRSTASPRL